MRFHGITDIGKLRNKNEDIIYYPTYEDEEKLFILADGMGGAKAGEVASKLALETSKAVFDTNIINAVDQEDIQGVIRNSIINANKIVMSESQKNNSYRGMGSTLIMAYACKNKIYIGHVGDSRVYRIRKNVIRQLTKDHSFAQELLRNGTITREEAENHPQRNALTKVIGYERNLEPDIIVKGFLKDDIILICSDGLSNMVSDEDIYKIIIKNYYDVRVVCRELVKAANNAGGADNISAIVISND